MSLEAEQALLGGLLLDSSAWDRVADLVSAEDFSRREHRLIFEAIQALVETGSVADAITVHERLKTAGDLDAAGGLAYIGSLANNTPSAANATSYARLVREKALERRLIAVAGEIVELAKGEAPISEKLDRAGSLVMALSERSTTTGPVTAGAVVPAVLDEIERRHKVGGGLIGLATGFVDLDRMTAGLQPADLIIVAGRPSSGKTTLAMGIAEHVAEGLGKTVIVFSMEMPKEQLLMRSIASLGRVDFQKLRTADLDKDDLWPKVTKATTRLSRSMLMIDDSAALSITELRSRARRVKREHGLALVVVDYLQLMRGEGQNRNLEVAHISAGLKALAKELHVPVVALSQLNREVTRDGRRPRLSDLRDSGAVEQDADVVLFVHRNEGGDESVSGIAEIIIGKQRNGPRGTINLNFNGSLVRFDNYAGPAIEDRSAQPHQWRGGFDYQN